MLQALPQNNDPRLLVGMETEDDAGVYQLNGDTALVLTADFITPPVDDPYVFGQVAAANSLSDVYAMGGRPLACLNLVAFPSKKLPLADLERIIAGAISKISEAGAVLAGGHSIEDEEPKFGLAVTGLVHPERIWRNSTARPGDRLILTKPVGSGVLFNANLKDRVSPADLEDCLEVITALNKKAAEVLAGFEVHACTDITGFGLAGHLFEMARGAGLTFRLELEGLPVMSGALEAYRAGVTTGANDSNRQLVSPHTRIESRLPAQHLEILYDPQTSGGLMAALPASQAGEALKKLHEAGLDRAAIVGEVTEQEREMLVFL